MSGPVFIRYDATVPPDDDHPSGYPAGAEFEVGSVEAAKKVHPHARIVRYVDGAEYRGQQVSDQTEVVDEVPVDPVPDTEPADVADDAPADPPKSKGKR
jgi:hypothetical protein